MIEFKRHIDSHLYDWKNSPGHKPIILRGARQVGKTTTVKRFAVSFKYRILLNLEKTGDRRYFEEYDSAKTIAESLFLSNNIPSDGMPDTLLFIDEIQESPNAIKLLRYFYEELPDLHVIAAGSLLEFAFKKVKSFPVGRVEYLYMHPLNFIEYLEAINHQRALEEIKKIPISDIAHPILLDLFNEYAIIGGMPEVLKVFIQKKSMADLPRIYESIWSTFKNDVEKYTTNETERKIIKHVMLTAHLYLDQRITFQNFGKSDYRSREVGEVFRNLDDAKIIQLIYPTTDIEIPAKPDIKKSPRLQFLDTGIINHTLGIQADMLGLKDLCGSYKGAVIPHLITQELISLNRFLNKKPLFWVREKKQSNSEVDLVLTYRDKLIPIEVKSGTSGSLKSLHQFIEQTTHPYAIRMYGGGFSVEKTKTPGGTPYILMNLPYYLTTKITEYVQWFIEKY